MKSYKKKDEDFDCEVDRAEIMTVQKDSFLRRLLLCLFRMNVRSLVRSRFLALVAVYLLTPVALILTSSKNSRGDHHVLYPTLTVNIRPPTMRRRLIYSGTTFLRAAKEALFWQIRRGVDLLC